jgi:hypothetical protein
MREVHFTAAPQVTSPSSWGNFPTAVFFNVYRALSVGLAFHKMSAQ